MGSSQRETALRGRARPTVVRRSAVLSLLGGRPVRARATFGRHGWAGCVEIEDSSFIPFGTIEDSARVSCFTLKPLASRLRYAFQVLRIRS